MGSSTIAAAFEVEMKLKLKIKTLSKEISYCSTSS